MTHRAWESSSKRTNWKSHNESKTRASGLDLPSSINSLTINAHETPKSTRWCSKAGRLSSEPAQPRQRRELAVVVQHPTRGRGPFGRSFLPCLSTNHIPAIRSHRARSIQHSPGAYTERLWEGFTKSSWGPGALWAPPLPRGDRGWAPKDFTK